MTFVRSARLVALALFAMGVAGTDALAQMPMGGGAQAPIPPGPAVFGGAQRSDPNAPQLTLSAQALGGYDDNVAGGQGGVGGGIGGGIDPRRQLASSFAGGGASLQFNQARTRVAYGGSVGGQYRSLFDVDVPGQQAYNAQGQLSIRASRHSSFNLGGNVAAQPFFQFGVVDGFNPSAGVGDTQPLFAPDIQASRLQVLQYGANAGYSHQLGSRTSFRAMAMRFGFTPLNADADDAGLLSLGVQSVGGGFQRRLTQNLGARLGYYHRRFDRPSRSTEFASVTSHDIDVGLNYSRVFSIARRTSFSFGTGTTIIRSTQAFTPDAGAQTRFFATGNAVLSRGFAQTWSSSLAYNRGVNYLTGLNRFGITDSVTAGVGGLLADRLDLSLSAQYLSGTFGFGGGARFDTLGGGAQLRYALSRNLAAFVGYTYARFSFPDTVSLPLGFPTEADRQGVRVGLTMWLDLLR